jgi:hypothetical protein
MKQKKKNHRVSIRESNSSIIITDKKREKEKRKENDELRTIAFLLLPTTRNGSGSRSRSRISDPHSFPSALADHLDHLPLLAESLHPFGLLTGFAESVLDGVAGAVEVEGDFFVVEL